jgi:hypothetical protein
MAKGSALISVPTYGSGLAESELLLNPLQNAEQIVPAHREEPPQPSTTHDRKSAPLTASGSQKVGDEDQ